MPDAVGGRLSWHSSSRRNLSVNKCQYMHSYSLRFLQASQNILISSCSVTVRLVDDVFLHRASQASSADHSNCREYFTANTVSLHPHLELFCIVIK